MVILGISCFYHDAAACLLSDGKIIAAAEEERFTRVKHDRSFPRQAIDFCIKTAGLAVEDIDYCVFHEKPFLKFERLIETIAQTAPFSLSLFQEVAMDWVADKLWIKSLIEEELNLGRDKIKFCEHHYSHAASSFYCSPFTEAAILTCDGVGEWATTTRGTAQASWENGGVNKIELFEEIRFPHSLGLLYSAFTAFLGFEVNEGEYKVMGMAAFGEPKYTDKVYKLVHLNEDGSFWLDMRYFSFHRDTQRSFSRYFIELFGSPRDPGARFVTRQTSLYDDPRQPSAQELETNQNYADIAASIQKVTQDILVAMCRQLFKKTGLKKLCLSGGVTLNCLANTRILKESGFEEIFIQPAAGDAGAAMGAALYLYHSVLGNKRRDVLKNVFLGPEFSVHEIKEFLDRNKIKAQFYDTTDTLCLAVVDALTQNKIIGWFQGRSEWGPRALGHRSILADPRDPKMKDLVNIKIKFREPFRPFAPTVLAQAYSQYFQDQPFNAQLPLKFMLYTVGARRQKEIPAVTHIDGTSRVQVLDPLDDPLYYQLIETFFHRTGVPVLLNTSFNLKGEPIVQTPADAFRTFQASGLDLLVLGPYIIKKY